MRIILLSFLLHLFFVPVYSQQPPEPSLYRTETKLPAVRSTNQPHRVQADICGNNIDDDNNLLTDRNDYSCYFNSVTPGDCRGSELLWIASGHGLHWSNVQTGEELLVGPMTGIIADDITWASNGKLYAADHITGNIFEIDPASGQPQFVHDVPGHYATNAMTADKDGNLILASKTVDGPWHIVRLNIATGEATIIADLSTHNLESAGDLTFFNGFLYITCNNNRIARINIADGEIQTATIINAPTNSIFGLVTLQDGFLYYSNINKLYKLDPVTLETSFHYSFQNTEIYALGLSTYGEFCQSPICYDPKISITIDSPAPYCSDNGVLLVANGTGIKGKTGYIWTLPDGDTASGYTLRTFKSGNYKLRYHTVPDTCGIETSTEINISPFPTVSIGGDQLICRGSLVTLQPQVNQVLSYLWQDGSTQPQLVAGQPGLYWLRVSNSCGVATDTVLLTLAEKPSVFIGVDTLLCPSTTLVLKNTGPRQPWDIYQWSTGSSNGEITVNDEGIYWLESANQCATTRDSIIITSKDACICDPVIPALNLGPDKELCLYDSLVLKNSLDNSKFKYAWQNGSIQNSLTVKSPGVYWVDVIASCGTLRDSIIIKEKITDCECLSYIPSAFTPNDDGKNDVFTILANCDIDGELRIYNRWGGLVFYTRDLSKGWDGRFGGQRQPIDVFVFQLDYHFLSRPGNYQKKGTVTLIR